MGKDEETAALAAALNAVHLGSAFDDLEDELPVDPTQVLDLRQQEDLMALRAQQSQKLRGVDKRMVVMFTDLVGSTQYYERYGDWKGREKVLTHNALLFPIIQSHSGTIVKTIGDAIMAYFGVASDALSAAAQMQQALLAYNRDASGDHQIHIRIALNAGVAITQQGDIYGDVVNVCARIEHSAQADEVLMGQGVVSSGWPIEPAGSATFKGKADPLPLFRLRWREVTPPKAAELPERFAVREQLAKGSSGELFLAEDRRTKLVVVVKRLYDFLAKDDETRNAFVTACRAMAKLQHEGVVRVLDHSRAEQRPAYFAAELVDGKSLTKQAPSPETAAQTVARVAEIIASTGMRHGGIDPDSVIVRRDGRVVVTNFGMSALTAIQVARGNSPPGNPAYIAPEVLLGNPVSERSDVYSLGALLYFLSSGREPVENAATLQGTIVAATGAHVPLPESVPKALRTVIDRALSLNPAQRYQDVTALRQALLGISEPLTPKRRASDDVQPPLRTEVIKRAPKREALDPRVLAAGVAVLLIAGFVLGRFTAPEAEPPRAQAAQVVAASLPASAPASIPASQPAQQLPSVRRGDAFVALRDGVAIESWSTDTLPSDIKQLTAMVSAQAVLHAIDTGRLRSLDQPVYELFPEWKQGKKQQVTLRHVLEHSTGLLTDDTPLAQNDVLRLALASEMIDAPGVRYAYNAKALGLLAGVIQRATGKRIDTYAAETLFAPLGITNYVWNVDAAGTPLIHTGLKLTAADLAKLVHALFRDGNKTATQPSRVNPDLTLAWVPWYTPTLRDPLRPKARAGEPKGYFIVDDGGNWVLVAKNNVLVRYSRLGEPLPDLIAVIKAMKL